MKHLLSWLLLSSLCSLSSWGIMGSLVVTQTPNELTVKEGDSVQIQCCWNQNLTRVTLNWLLNGTLVSNHTKLESKMVTNGQCQGQSQHKVACNCSNLTLSNITVNHSDLYICKVSIEIPGLLQSHGNGTRITVTARTFNDTKDTGPPPPTATPTATTSTASGSLLLYITIPLAVLVTLSLAALLCLLKLRRRRQGGSDRASRVIYETPHHQSQELEMTELGDQAEGGDSRSTNSSRGSSQWCEVKVYESLDYFDVEKKGNS